MEDIILVGYGGHAKSIADCIERQGQYRIAGYTDVEKQTSVYNYLGTDDELKAIYDSGVKNAVVAIGYMGNGNLRERLYEKIKMIGFSLPIIVDPSAIISDSVTLGEGTFVGKGVIINSEAYVGKMTIINTKALIEHECKVEDFAHVAVAAVLCGNVTVKKSAFVGANATVIQGRIVEERQLVPAGTTVR